jgi:secreted trypsin-like serine protease
MIFQTQLTAIALLTCLLLCSSGCRSNQNNREARSFTEKQQKTAVVVEKEKFLQELRSESDPMNNENANLILAGIDQNYRPVIVGGDEATPDSFPWQVAIRFKKSKYQVCSGSLIRENWVLTAAHCFPDGVGEKDRMEVYVGSIDLVSGGIGVSIRNIFCKTGCQQDPVEDIALLHVEKPTVPTGIVQLIDDDDTAEMTVTGPGQKGVISGWGYTKLIDPSSGARKLRFVDVPFVSRDVCNQVFSGIVTTKMICTGGQAGRGACFGDSGGPLVAPFVDPLQPDKFKLVGVIGSAQPCAEEKQFEICARVRSHLKWIKDTIDGNP